MSRGTCLFTKGQLARFIQQVVEHAMEVPIPTFQDEVTSPVLPKGPVGPQAHAGAVGTRAAGLVHAVPPATETSEVRLTCTDQQLLGDPLEAQSPGGDPRCISTTPSAPCPQWAESSPAKGMQPRPWLPSVHQKTALNIEHIRSWRNGPLVKEAVCSAHQDPNGPATSPRLASRPSCAAPSQAVSGREPGTQVAGVASTVRSSDTMAVAPAQVPVSASPSSSSLVSEADEDQDDSWMDAFIARSKPWESVRLRNTPVAINLLQAVRELQPKLAYVLTARLLVRPVVEIHYLLSEDGARTLQKHVVNLVRGFRRCMKYGIL